jgi:glycerophosphoryl diester phosphodiesterase
MDWLSTPPPLILGHRGASAEAPENTIAAFGLAAEQGAHGVELDVRLCASGDVVVIHDDTIDRTTSGSGRVSELTLDELQQVDAGMEQTIPSLDDVFQLFGPSLLYNVELKSGALLDGKLEAAVADRIAAYHLENHVVVSSFNPFSLRRARRELSSSTMTGFLWFGGPHRLLRKLAPTQADHPHHTRVDKAYVTWARKNNYRIHVWTVDAPQEARRLAALGVDAIITNKPGLIREALNDAV